MSRKIPNGAILALVALAFGIGATTNALKNNTTSQKIHVDHIVKAKGQLNAKTKKELSELDFKTGNSAIKIVNKNNAQLNTTDWQENKIDYANLDKYNRTSNTVTAYLEPRNLTNSSLRVRQIIEPTGWHYNHGTQIYNRGHLIAYSLSKGIGEDGLYHGSDTTGDQNNIKNLFTQTAFSNQKLQVGYENAVRNTLKSGSRVIYQATPIFRGNEKMARGINLQALSLDGMLNFNVYIFNIQPGYRFNYQTGQAIRDKNIKVR